MRRHRLKFPKHWLLLFAGAAVTFSCASSAGAWCASNDGAEISRHHPLDTWKNGSVQMDPQWSPDGNRIVFTARPPGEFFMDTSQPGGVWPRGIWKVGSDGSSLRTVLDDPELSHVYDHSPRISPDGSRVVYSTTRHRITDRSNSAIRNYEIETSRLDGSDRRRITDSDFQDMSPTWSPDGTRIAFARIYPTAYGGETESGIYVANADGSGLRQVFPFMITSTYGDPETNQFFDNDTKQLRRQIYRAGPEWSPDGDYLAFASNSLHRGEDIVYIVRTDGSEYRTLFVTLPNPVFVHRVGRSLTWSPDGNAVAFFTFLWQGYRTNPPATEEPDSQVETYDESAVGTIGDSIYAVNIDGSELHELATDLPLRHIGATYLPARSLAWSPDGTRILFTDAYSYPGSVYSIGKDGDSLRKVADGLYAAWSPDGTEIAVVNPETETYLTILKEDGTIREIVASASLGGAPGASQ